MRSVVCTLDEAVSEVGLVGKGGRS
jgi:hypothetical protein